MRSMEKNLLKFIRKKFWFLTFLIAWLISNTIAIRITKIWGTDQKLALIFGNILFIICLFYFVGIFKLGKKLSGLEESKIDRYYQISFWLLVLLTFALPFLFMIHVPYSPHDWDYFVIFNSTTELQGHSFAQLPFTESRLGYFLRYPNNQFFGLLFNRVFAPFSTHLQLKLWIVTGVSAFFTSLGVSATSLLVKNLGNKKQAILYHAIALGFIPFYVYGAQLYSDTLTLPFVVLSSLFFIYALKSRQRLKQIFWFFGGSLFVALGYQFKPTTVIICIAVLIFIVINKKWKQLALVLPLFGVLFWGVNELVKTTVSTEPAFSIQANERYNLPLMHWVTMSWSPTNKTGGFNKKIRLYSESFPTYEEKKEADVQLFIHNIKKMGPLGVIKQIGRKLRYTWTFGDLNSSYYTYYHENEFVHRYFDYLDMGTHKGEGNVTGWFMLKAVQTLYWILLLILAGKEIWRLLRYKKNWSNLWTILAASVVGLSLFLILWETNSRYLYHFAPLMIALTAASLSYSQMTKKSGKNPLLEV